MIDDPRRDGVDEVRRPIERRGFLLSLLAAGALFLGVPGLFRGRGRERSKGQGIRAPGDIAVVEPPSGCRNLGVQYRLDGRAKGTVPMEVPPSGSREIRVAGWPPGKRPVLGRHDFYLVADGRAVHLGGYRINPFRFGC